MTKFVDLLAGGAVKSPSEQQLCAQECLPIAISSSNLNVWKPGDSFAKQGRRILVGVATYSIADLCLLDALNELLNSNTLGCDRVDVFNVLDCRTTADFDEYVPTIGTVFQTPVVGVWEGGVLKEKASGAAARNLLYRLYPNLPNET